MTTASSLVTSRSNARVKQLRAAFAGQARLAGGLAAIEGGHLLAEALRSNIVLKTVFVAEDYPVPAAVPRSVEVLRLASDVLASAVETPSPQGVAALFVPPVRQVADMLRDVPLLLVACGLQDPGNLGTLVRSAEAFGATGVLTTPATVGAWNQKAIRASAGSIFRVPVLPASLDQIAALRVRGVRLLAAVGARGLPIADAPLALPCAILIGNEGAGLADEWLAIADARLTVPCPGPVESLNAAVAGSLILYEASRHRAAMR